MHTMQPMPLLHSYALMHAPDTRSSSTSPFHFQVPLDQYVPPLADGSGPSIKLRRLEVEMYGCKKYFGCERYTHAGLYIEVMHADLTQHISNSTIYSLQHHLPYHPDVADGSCRVHVYPGKLS